MPEMPGSGALLQVPLGMSYLVPWKKGRQRTAGRGYCYSWKDANPVSVICTESDIKNLTYGLATAGEKMKAYEMGEAGQVVLFPMSPQEIAAEAAL